MHSSWENKHFLSHSILVAQQYSCHMHEVAKSFIQPFNKNDL